MAFSLRARWVFPVDRPPIEGGVVTIDGERIVDVSATPSGEVTDLGDVVLLPGFVNAHTHLEFSNLSQPLGKPGMSLPEWIRLVIAERGKFSPLADLAGLRGVTESWQHGVTTIGDIFQGFLNSTEQSVAEPSMLTLFLEVIGFSRARAASAFAATESRLAELASRCKARIGISPHAPYTVSPDLLRQLIQLAVDRQLPVAMHIAESREELQLLRDGLGPFQELLDERSMWDAEAIPIGSRPLDYLQALAAAPRSLVIHGNYLAADELAYIGANRERMSLVYCPRTHAYFGHEPYPLAQAIAAGVRVAVGTDSRASNPDLSLLGELRFIARSHRSISPSEILQMGTLLGAEALGRECEVGSLTTGKIANLVAVPLGDRNVGSADGALEAVLFGEQLVSRVWMHGAGLARQ